jgi:hypothetical protein
MFWRGVQDRTFVRVMMLAVACVLGFGRQTLTRWVVTLGLGQTDWTSWSNLVRGWWVFRT